MIDKVILTNKSSNLYINDYGFLVPTGTIVCYAGSSAPDGWLFCEGQSLPKTTYANLHNVIQYKYGGSGDNFNLPDLKERFPMGKSNNTNINTNTLGVTGGANSVTLTANNLPAHTHTASSTSEGGHSHTGSTSTNGSHNHTYTDVVYSENYSGGVNNLIGSSSTDNDNSYYTRTGTTIDSGNHSHTLNIDSNGSHTHTITVGNNTTNNTAIDITNKYIVLNYIIRY
jgi:microcystin-dependent protein